jgi:Putative beta barrel porin-7 (BBP7)
MRHPRLTAAIMVAALAGVAAGTAPTDGSPGAPNPGDRVEFSAPDGVEVLAPVRLSAASETAESAPQGPEPMVPSADHSLPAVGPGVGRQALAGSGGWADFDYLSWRVRRAPLPTPLVTTGNPTDPLPGALGQPGTRSLFGGSGLDFGTFSGGRLDLGRWLDREQTVGVEAGGFVLEQRAVRFAAGSDRSGNPPIYFPVVNQDPTSPNFGRQSIYTVADPLFPDPTGPTFGNVYASTATRLWGTEANGLINLARTPGCAVDGIVGFRYLNLQENLRLSGFSNDLFDDLQQTFQDSFGTCNQFYGGQLGARFSYHGDCFTLAATGKIALGATHEVVNIQGGSVWGGTGFAPPPGFYLGGVYTQPTNISRGAADAFAVVPQLGLKLAVNLTPCLTANVGYDVLYWSSVVRPGNQIDHNLNPTQFPGAGFTGAPLPTPLFNRSDFLAHGLSFGLTYSY